MTTTRPKTQRKKRARSRGQKQLGLFPLSKEKGLLLGPGARYAPPSFLEPMCHLTAPSGRVCAHMN